MSENPPREVTKYVPTTAAREIQSFNWLDVDTVTRAKAAIRSLEQGQFNAAAQLSDAMDRDDRVSGCMLARTWALPSLPRKISASKEDDARREAIAAELDEKFDRMLPAAELVKLMGWGLTCGVGLGQNIWELVDGSWDFRLQVWHPQYLSWRQDTRSLWVQTESGQVEVKAGDPQWLLYTPFGTSRPWMGGLIRSLYIPWMVHQFGWRDWGRYSEVYGTPTKLAKHPDGVVKEDVTRFVRNIARAGTEMTVALAQGKSGNPQDDFDVELLEATGTGYDGFDKLLSKAETAIAVRTLGQNLSTEVKGGSYAAAAVHGNIRNDILKGDARSLANCLSEQNVAQWVEFNHGDRTLAPTIGWHTDPPEDKKSGADAIASFGASIKTLSDLGVPIDVQAMAKRFDVPLRELKGKEDEETKIAGQIYGYHLEAGVVTVNEVRQRLGFEPLKDKAAGDALVKAAPPAPEPGARPVDDDEEDDEEAPKKKAPPPFGKKKVAQASTLAAGPDPLVVGQLYLEGLSDTTAQDGAQAIKPDVLALLTAIDESKGDFDDLRRRLQAVIADPTELALVLEKACILAELNGKLSVLEGL